MNSESRVLHTHHPMLAPESSYHYDGCIGGKTGYTSEAGNTLVTAAEKNGTTYITVTMKAADLAVASTDSTALFNYGYQNFTKAQVNGGEVLVPNGVTVDNLTVQENSQNGNTVNDYYYNDYLLGSVEVLQRMPFLIHPEEIQIRRIKMRNQILSEKKKLLQACQSCEKYF